MITKSVCLYVTITNHQLTLFINQLFLTINFTYQSSLFINQLYLSINYIHQSTLFINQLYSSSNFIHQSTLFINQLHSLFNFIHQSTCLFLNLCDLSDFLPVFMLEYFNFLSCPVFLWSLLWLKTNRYFWCQQKLNWSRSGTIYETFD